MVCDVIWLHCLRYSVWILMLVMFCRLQDQNFQYCKSQEPPPKLSTNCTGRPTYLVGIVQDNKKVDDSLYKVLGR